MFSRIAHALRRQFSARKNAARRRISAAVGVVETLECRRMLSCGGGGGMQTIQFPDAMAGDNTGFAMDARDNLILVGAPGRNAAYLLNAADGSVVKTFANPDAAGFGQSVVILGKHIAIGAPFGEAGQGTVYVYEKDGEGNWGTAPSNTLHGYKYSGNSLGSSMFGSALAGYSDVNGGQIVDHIVATAGQGAEDGDGRVYVIDADVAPPQEDQPGVYEQAFESSYDYFYRDYNGALQPAWDNFGSSLAVRQTGAGTQVLIGARQGGGDAEGITTSSGQAFLFDVIPGTTAITTAFTQEYDDPRAMGSDFFGAKVGFWGDNVVIGAPGDGDLYATPETTDGVLAAGGKVYIFAPNGTIQTISNPSPLERYAPEYDALGRCLPASPEAFGYSFAISGNQIQIGAPGATTPVTVEYYDEFTGGTVEGTMDVPAGAVYTYDLSSLTLLKTTADPTAPDPYTYDLVGFGAAVGMAAGKLVVADPYADTATAGTDAGEVYIFGGGGSPTIDPPTATFTGSTADEGSEATVSFSDQTCPCTTPAPFRYSIALDPADLAETYDAAIDADTKSFGGFIGTRTVYGRIFDKGNAYTQYTAEITINNVAPMVASIATSGTAVRNFEASFASTFTDPGSATGEKYQMSWDFGDGTAPVAGKTQAAHTYAAAGTYTVTFTVSDDNGGTGSATMQVTVKAAGVDSAGNLLVGGNVSSANAITVAPATGGYSVFVNSSQGVIGGVTGDIVIRGGNAGNVIVVASSVTRHTFIFGGAGLDMVRGGNGGNVIVGNGGTDLLVGGSGRDILIGGGGVDMLVGNANDDILISGMTSYDNDLPALQAIFAVWSRTDKSYTDRVNTLRGGSTTLPTLPALNDDTVFDDGQLDILAGNAGSDWFLFNKDRDGGVRDLVTDLSSKEFADDIDFISQE